VRNDMTICNLDGVNPLDRNSWRMSVSVARCCLPRSPGQPQHLKYQNRIWWWWYGQKSPDLNKCLYAWCKCNKFGKTKNISL